MLVTKIQCWEGWIRTALPTILPKTKHGSLRKNKYQSIKKYENILA